MKNILKIITIAALSTFTGYAATADVNRNWYVSGAGTIGWQNDIKFTQSFDGKESNQFKLKHDTSSGLSLAIGHIINNWRVEFEISSRENQKDPIKNIIFIEILDNEYPHDITIQRGNYDFSYSNLSFMANIYYDIPVTELVSFYLGMGAGCSLIYGNEYHNNIKLHDSKRIVSHLDTVFALQGMAGLSLAVTEYLDLYAGYRVLTTEKPTLSKIQMTWNDSTSSKYKYVAKSIPVTNNVELGIRFKF